MKKSGTSLSSVNPHKVSVSEKHWPDQEMKSCWNAPSYPFTRGNTILTSTRTDRVAGLELELDHPRCCVWSPPRGVGVFHHVSPRNVLSRLRVTPGSLPGLGCRACCCCERLHMCFGELRAAYLLSDTRAVLLRHGRSPSPTYPTSDARPPCRRVTVAHILPALATGDL